VTVGRPRGRFVLVLRVLIAAGAVMVLLLPWLRHLTDASLFDAVEALLGMQCHRLAGRVIQVGSTQMAVCSRCAGIYAGIGIGVGLGRPRWLAKTTAWVVAVAGVSMLVEIGLEAFGVVPVAHAIRWMTGMALSWPVAALAIRWVGGELVSNRAGARARQARRSARDQQ